MSRPKGKTYTLQVLREGFERFKREHGHYPSTLEVDACPYLCSARQIQRKFGGLFKLSQLMGIDEIDYAHGEHRKTIWSNVGTLSLSSEKSVGELLKSKYGEICVHEEKKYGPGRSRLDFFVYAQENFAVEVFNTFTLHGVTGNLSSKLKKYADFEGTLFFVITGGDFTQEEIDKKMDRLSKNKFKPNMRCVCFSTFCEECITKFAPLSISVEMKMS
jgi:hypothetical protein